MVRHSSQTPNHFTDSSSNSISTSPSSAASSLQAYTNLPIHYTSVATFPGPVQLPQSFVTSSYASTRVPSLYVTTQLCNTQRTSMVACSRLTCICRYDGPTPGMLPPPPRSGITTIDAGDREAYATATTPYLARSQLSPHSLPGFGTYPDTPRTVLSGAAASLSPGFGYASQMASSGGYGTSPSECLNFPWPSLEILLDMTCEGQAVTPEIHAKVEKGFFLSTSDQKWTCYRRNYFSVACHFELHPNINNGRLFLKRNNNQEQIQAMGMRLSAAVDGSQGKSIELIQHTPKRDNGPKTKIDVTKVAPTPSSGRNDHTLSPHGVYQVPMPTFHATGAVPGPFLPMQNSGETNGATSSVHHTSGLSSQYPYSSSSASHLPVPGQNATHTFERVQFKQATANNGKRRASQQYFHLIVELFADVRKDGSETPVWVKVAQRVSEKIVVRGRSPSHYQNEGNHGQSGRGSASGGSGYSTASGGSYGGMNAGGFRSSTGTYGGNMSGAGGYRANHYAMNAGSDGDGSGSSPGSVDEGAVDTNHPIDAVMSDAERAGIHDYEGYQYYPSTIYEGVPQQTLPPLAKVESLARYSTDPRQYVQHAVKAEYTDAMPGAQWQVGGCGRFQGVESSRGYYPDLSAGYS